MTPILHLAGAGRTARTLARLFAELGVVEIGQVCNRSVGSAERAVAWIGHGRAVEGFEPVGHDDWLMVGVPDSAIEERVGQGLPHVALAFHLSGAESSQRLEGVAAAIAAVHPVCAFADPDRAVRAFPGSFVVGEGDASALDRLLPAFEAIGARTLRYTPADKRLYHAAMIAASNFLCTLDALALDLAEAGGLATEQALALITSLQSGVLGTIAEQGPQRALTGPIERGDAVTCRTLMEHVHAVADPDFAARVEPVLAALGRATVELARAKQPDRETDWDELQALFRERVA